MQKVRVKKGERKAKKAQQREGLTAELTSCSCPRMGIFRVTSSHRMTPKLKQSACASRQTRTGFKTREQACHIIGELKPELRAPQ